MSEWCRDARQRESKKIAKHEVDVERDSVCI